jgi:uncharacterized membrane protein
MCTNLLKWLKLAKTTILSFVLVIVSAFLASIISVSIFKDQLPEAWKIAGMLTGCYTGGTPNLIAIGLSLKVPGPTIVLANTSDMMIGGVYFLLLTSVVKNVYRKYLKPFDLENQVSNGIKNFMNPVFTKGFKNGMLNILITVTLSIIVTSISIGISFLFYSKIEMIPVLIVVTTLGIILSFSKKIHQINGTWNIAEYIILVFSIGLGGTVDIKEFLSSSPTMLLYVFTMMFSALIIHFMLCKVFKIDADTALITSTAGIYGPAFIGPVAKALDNQEVVVSGLLTGLFGYAIGNYLGLLFAFLMNWIL